MQKPTLVTEKPQQIQHHLKPRSRSPRNFPKEEAAAPAPKIVVKTEPPSSVFPAQKSPNSNHHENIYRVSSQPPKLLPLLPSAGEHHATAGKRRSMPTLYSHPIVPQSLFFKEEPPNSPTYHGATSALVNGAVSYSLATAVNGASGAVSIPGARFQHDQHRRPSAPALPHYQPVKNSSSRSSPTVAPSRGLPSYKYNNRRMAPVSELLARMRGVPKSEISRMNSAPNAGKRARRLHTIVHAQHVPEFNISSEPPPSSTSTNSSSSSPSGGYKKLSPTSAAQHQKQLEEQQLEICDLEISEDEIN